MKLPVAAAAVLGGMQAFGSAVAASAVLPPMPLAARLATIAGAAVLGGAALGALTLGATTSALRRYERSQAQSQARSQA